MRRPAFVTRSRAWWVDARWLCPASSRSMPSSFTTSSAFSCRPIGRPRIPSSLTGKREQRVMRDQHLEVALRRFREMLADEIALLRIDPPVLDRQRPRGVEPEHRHALHPVPRAKRVIDILLVACKRRQKTAEHVVQRHVVIARHRQHFVTRVAQMLEEFARLLILLGLRPLGEIAADDDEVGGCGVHLGKNGRDDSVVMRAEVEVG